METIHCILANATNPTNLIALTDPLISVRLELLMNVLQLQNHHLCQLVEVFVLSGQS